MRREVTLNRFALKTGFHCDDLLSIQDGSRAVSPTLWGHV
jgi:hypothetical protein